eukprot:CFRG8413T1
MHSKQLALVEYFRGTWKYSRVITSTQVSGEVLGKGSGTATWRLMMSPSNVAAPITSGQSQYLLMREMGSYMATVGMTKAIEASKQQIWEFQQDTPIDAHSKNLLDTVQDADAIPLFASVNVFFTQAPLKYLSAIDPLSEDVNVFPLGELFHPLKLKVRCSSGQDKYEVEQQRTESEHWCSPDQYDGFFEGFSSNSFTSVWRVSGPEKAYAIETKYQLVERGN